jgi:hypothetical protein
MCCVRTQKHDLNQEFAKNTLNKLELFAHTEIYFYLCKRNQNGERFNSSVHDLFIKMIV